MLRTGVKSVSVGDDFGVSLRGTLPSPELPETPGLPRTSAEAPLRLPRSFSQNGFCLDGGNSALVIGF